MPSGRLLSFEGIDGSGKSTQARRLAEAMRSAGREVVLTREPGGSPGAEEIRRLLVGGAPDRWSPEAETLLFTAARRDHMDRTIGPALDAGRTVISDRYVDSTRVYQGVARSDLRPVVDSLHRMMIGREADQTFIIDTDPEVALARNSGAEIGEGRYESFGLGFQVALRAGFLDLAREAPGRCRVIDGNRPAEAIAVEVARIALP